MGTFFEVSKVATYGPSIPFLRNPKIEKLSFGTFWDFLIKKGGMAWIDREIPKNGIIPKRGMAWIDREIQKNEFLKWGLKNGYSGNPSGNP